MWCYITRSLFSVNIESVYWKNYNEGKCLKTQVIRELYGIINNISIKHHVINFWVFIKICKLFRHAYKVGSQNVINV